MPEDCARYPSLDVTDLIKKNQIRNRIQNRKGTGNKLETKQMQMKQIEKGPLINLKKIWTKWMKVGS